MRPWRLRTERIRNSSKPSHSGDEAMRSAVIDFAHRKATLLLLRLSGVMSGGGQARTPLRQPLPSAFQVRISAGLSYTLFELDPTTGFEPASAASVARCSSSELRGEIGAPDRIKLRTPMLLR